VNSVKAIETKDGLILEVYVKPRSKTFKVIVDKDEIVVFCQEEPVKGKVNREITRELSKLFCKKVEIISGFSSRQKKLLVKGAKKGDAERILPGLGV
jgi:uncharacterized protein (TIGR00251 family)